MRVLLLTQWKPKRGGIVTHVDNLVKHSKNEFMILSYPRHPNMPFLRAMSFLLVGMLLGVRRSYDIIHAHYALPQGLLGVLLKRIKKRPLILTLHGSDITLLGDNPLTKPFVRSVLRNADAVIAVSQFLKKETVKLGIEEERVRVIYAGVGGGKQGRATPKGKRVVFVGSLVKQKGVDTLLHAFKRVIKKHDDAELLVVGDGKDRRTLERMSRELGIKTSFLGNVEDIEKVLIKSAVLVLPSREEGFGLVLLEAMQAGVPVVATKVGGIPEIVVNGENGLLVEKEDVNALATAVIKLLEDKALRNRLILKGIKTAEKYSWANMAGEVDILYREVSERNF